MRTEAERLAWREYMRRWRALHPNSGAETSRQYRARNPEKVRAAQKQWRLRNPEKLRALQRRWQLLHPVSNAKQSEIHHLWRISNPEKAKRMDAARRKKYHTSLLAGSRLYYVALKSRPEAWERRRLRLNAWRRAHPECSAVSTANRRARLSGCQGVHSQTEWRALRASYMGLCVYCLKAKATHRDHITALKHGGSNDISNIAPACGPCNSQKSATPLLVWLARKAATK